VTSAQTIVLRVDAPADSTTFAAVLASVANAGGEVTGVRTISTGRETVTRDIEVHADDEVAAHVVSAIRGHETVTLGAASAISVHAWDGGTMTMRNRASVASRDDLAMAYTPGVARVCMAIHHDIEQAWDVTIKGNSVMVTGDGSDVAGEGDLGPLAALPACEATAAVLRQVGDVDGMPLPIDERDLDAAAVHIHRVSSVFAGVHLTAMSADRASALAEKLRALLEVPVTTDLDVPVAGLAGFWRGALDARARSATAGMLWAAASASNGPLDRTAAANVAAAVTSAARSDGVARTT
jgi:malate dehydrogenase (oxaloacetate-decarboxylating)